MHCRVAITNMGATTPIGVDTAAVWASIERGQHGIGPIAHFAGSALEAEVGGSMARAFASRRRGDAALAFAVRAAREALGGPSPTPGRIAIVLGTTMAPRDRAVAELAAELRSALGLGEALVLVVSTACTSSSAAIATGAMLLGMGAADRVLAGGTDELDLKSFAGFHALHLLSDQPCTPFGEHIGTTLGEGAAFFLLERERDARDGGRTPLAILEGTGTSSDGYHATSPHPAGDGLARAARAALDEACVIADDIDWVSAHGTGTAANDATESLAIQRVFGDRGVRIPVSASKSLVGHTLGAAGAIELVIAILAMDHRCVPPTASVKQRRAACSVNLVTELLGNPSRRVLKLASAFGGANAALVLARPDAVPGAPRERARRVVHVAGAAAVGTSQAAVDPMGDAVDLRGPVGGFVFEDHAPGIDPRSLDATSRLLIVAAHRALQRARLELGCEAVNLAGLFEGQRRASPSSTDDFEKSIETRGLLGASGSAFTRRVLNTPTGAASRGLALRGPTTTLSTGRGSGLVAVVLAVEHLASRDDADVLLAGGVDELAAFEDPTVAGEGAALVLLEASSAFGSGRRAIVAGWALGGPREREVVVARAKRQAGLDPQADIAPFEPEAGEVGVPAIVGVLALGRALAAIESGTLTHALVVEVGELATTALVLAANERGGGDAT